MDFIKIGAEDFEGLMVLQTAYKAEIGEAAPTSAEFESLKEAIEKGQIHFYGCRCDNALVACCSICYTYSTFHYGKAGVFRIFTSSQNTAIRGSRGSWFLLRMSKAVWAPSPLDALTATCQCTSPWGFEFRWGTCWPLENKWGAEQRSTTGNQDTKPRETAAPDRAFPSWPLREQAALPNQRYNRPKKARTSRAFCFSPSLPGDFKV